MRDRKQLELTVSEYYEANRAERQRLLVQLKGVLRSARERREPWYEWVLELRRRRLEGLPPIPPVDEEGRLL